MGRLQEPDFNAVIRMALAGMFITMLVLTFGCGSGNESANYDRSAAFGRVLVSSSTSPNLGIFAMDADGSDVVQLTHGFAFEPEWSPDGSRIVFSSSGSLFVMNADGSGRVQLTSWPIRPIDPILGSRPTWSADGEQIAFAGRLSEGQGVFNQGIYLMNRDGSGLMRITVPPFDYDLGMPNTDSEPTWSPDGSRIAFVRGSILGGGDIYAVHPDGSDLTQVTDSGSASGPAWSPDSQRLVFVRNDMGIYVMNADGSHQRRLTKNSSDDGPFWSPDGKFIAFFRCSRVGLRIYSMNADGSRQEPNSENIDWVSPGRCAFWRADWG